MKKNDIEFLMDLQHKLNTQSNDGNADPVFWGVMEEKKMPAYPGCGDGVELVIDYESIYEEKQLGELIEWMRDTEDFDESELETITDLNDAEEYLNEKGYECNGIFDFEYRDVLSRDSGVFLTKEACQLYIKNNRHNLCNPYTFAMTAFRNFEFKELLRILKTADFAVLSELNRNDSTIEE